MISGLIARSEVADVVAATLSSPSASGCTFEVRRGMGLEAQGKQSGPEDLARMLLRLVTDRQRTSAGLAPLPVPVPYEPPAVAPAPAAVTADVEAVRGWIDAWRARTKGGVVSAAPAKAPANVEGARVWIATWRARTGGVAVAAATSGGAAVPANVREAREWIRSWRARSLETKLPAEVEA